MATDDEVGWPSASDDYDTASMASTSSEVSDVDLESDALPADSLRWLRCVLCVKIEGGLTQCPCPRVFFLLPTGGGNSGGAFFFSRLLFLSFIWLESYCIITCRPARAAPPPHLLLFAQVDIAGDGAAVSQQRRLHGGKGSCTRA